MLLNPANALCKDLILYVSLNLILNSNQGQPLLDKNISLGLIDKNIVKTEQ